MSDFRRLSFPEIETRGDRTRLKLVEAALDVLRRSGPGALTFEAVGLASGMNRSQVRYHYKSLELLMSEAVRWIAHRSQVYTVAHVEGGRDARERLDRFIEAAFLAARDIPEQIPLLLYWQSRAAHDRTFRELYRVSIEAGAERLCALLGAALEPASVDRRALDSVAEEIRASLAGLVVEMVLRGETKKAAAYAASAKALLWARSATIRQSPP